MPHNNSFPGGGSADRLAFLLDLDGTLVDSVYRHVLAWQEAFRKKDHLVAAWRVHRRIGMSGAMLVRVHRRIGMSGAMLVRAMLRESGHQPHEEEVKQIEDLHGDIYGRLVSDVKPLPGARELLEELTRLKRPWAIVTSSKPEKAEPVLKTLGLKPGANVVTRGEVPAAKPEPDPFWVGAQKLSVNIGDCVVVGDSVWDLLSAQRARALAVGLLTGGCGRGELDRAGAYRVYEDPADLLRHLDELGVHSE